MIVLDNDELNDCKLSTLVSSVVNLVLIDALAAVNEPLISEAIWAELDSNVLPNSLSAVDILLANEELVEVNEPLISEAICAELDNKVGLFVISAKSVDMFAISEAILAEVAVNEPEISVAIWADPDNTPTEFI